MSPVGRPLPFRTRKALGLLVYLAAEPRPHTREALADLLWSRAASPEARHSLANAISEVRRRLGKSAVETTGDRVRLRTDLVSLDLQRLVSGDVLGNEVDGPLDVDGFLEGFELPDAMGFAHWKEGLDVFTCTECGRCKDACPTHQTGKPLSRRRPGRCSFGTASSSAGCSRVRRTRRHGGN